MNTMSGTPMQSPPPFGPPVEVSPPAERTQFNNLFKTQLCKHFQQNKHCAKGQSCHFAHGDSELRKKEDVSVGLFDSVLMVKLCVTLMICSRCRSKCNSRWWTFLTTTSKRRSASTFWPRATAALARTALTLTVVSKCDFHTTNSPKLRPILISAAILHFRCSMQISRKTKTTNLEY